MPIPLWIENTCIRIRPGSDWMVTVWRLRPLFRSYHASGPNYWA